MRRSHECSFYAPCVLTCNCNPQACVCCACGFAGSVYGPGTSNDMPPRPLLYPLLHACCVVPGVAVDSLGRLASKLRKAMWPTSPDYFARCWQQHWCVATPALSSLSLCAVVVLPLTPFVCHGRALDQSQRVQWKQQQRQDQEREGWLGKGQERGHAWHWCVPVWLSLHSGDEWFSRTGTAVMLQSWP